MATAKRLTERVNQSPFAGAGGAIDEEAGVVRGVGLCGLVSENGRDYPLPMLQRDHGKYDGAKVFFEHNDERTGRKFRDWVGLVRRPSCVASGSCGDIEVFKSDPNVPKLLEALRKCPEKFGMSHVANCKTRRENGREIVEAIDTVESVDIVLNPATNPGGFFRHESKGHKVGLTVKALCEALVKHPKTTAKQVGPLKALAEMDGMDDMAATDLDAPPADDADPAEGITAAFKTAFDHVRDQLFAGELDKKAALKKLASIFDSHEDVNGDGEPADAGADSGADDDPVPESKKPTYAGVLAECKAAGLESPAADYVAVLLDVPTKDARAALILREKVSAANAAAERPRSGTRAPGAAETGKPVREERAVPTDGKSFAASIRG